MLCHLNPTKVQDRADESLSPFAVHDPDYRASLADWNSFAEALTQKLIGIDELIPELPTKDIVSTLSAGNGMWGHHNPQYFTIEVTLPGCSIGLSKPIEAPT